MSLPNGWIISNVQKHISGTIVINPSNEVFFTWFEFLHCESSDPRAHFDIVTLDIVIPSFGSGCISTTTINPVFTELPNPCPGPSPSFDVDIIEGEICIDSGCTDCCEAPDISELSFNLITAPAGQNQEVEICYERENCSNTDFLFVRFREKGTNIWTQEIGVSNCLLISLNPCKEYEIRGRFLDQEECSLSDWSESVCFTTECEPICCDIEGEIKVRQKDCNSVNVCVIGFEDCENVTYNVYYTDEDGNLKFVGPTNERCFTISRLNVCKKYVFTVQVFSEGCPSIPIHSEEFSFSLRCRKDCDKVIGPVGGRIIPSNPINPQEDIKAYPNPFQTDLEISLTAEMENYYELQIMDLQGRIITKQQGKIQKGINTIKVNNLDDLNTCLLYTSPSPRDATLSRMPSSA